MDGNNDFIKKIPDTKVVEKKAMKIVAAIFIVVIFVVVIGSLVLANALLPYNREDTSTVDFKVESGWGSSTVVDKLYEQHLIKNAKLVKLYLKINPRDGIKEGTYPISPSMSVDEIFDLISSNKSKENATVSLKLIEGKRFVDYADDIHKVFDNISTEDIINKGKDKEYLQKLVNKYWFITDDILNDKLYYPLEGYLFADTYAFDKNSNLEDIFGKMLDEMDSTLKLYKDKIDDSSLGSHGLLTLASVVELEGVSETDRKVLAGVFYNRLRIGMTLGSDVTTYYAEQKPLTDSLWQSELDACNAYNTRGTCVKGLPVGPIASPSKSSIVAAIEPESSNYLYFVADNKNKLYFAEDGYGHQKNINDLRAQGIYPE
jgi:UPF0755 protein